MSHFANADQVNGIQEPIERIEKLLTRIEENGGDDILVSIANSAAILQYPDTHCHSVRPGIALYGISPFAHDQGADWDLRSVMSLKSSIIAIQYLSEGDAVGYGSIFRAPAPMRIGIVPCGYGDGYPRHARADNQQRTPVLVDGVRTQLVGRVSMDLLYVDITRVPSAGVGSPVVLWGDKLSVEEVADFCATIPYDLVTRISSRPKRVIIPAT